MARKRSRNKGLFASSRSKKYSKIISVESPAKATHSIEVLHRNFRKSKSRPNKLKIARRTMYAGNRAKAMGKKSGLSAKERHEFSVVGNHYQKAAKTMFREYNQGKKRR